MTHLIAASKSTPSAYAPGVPVFSAQPRAQKLNAEAADVFFSARRKPPTYVPFPILPEEQEASDLLVEGINRFFMLMRPFWKTDAEPEAEKLANEFVEHIHVCQKALPALRFYDQNNRNYVVQHGGDLEARLAERREAIPDLRNWRRKTARKVNALPPAYAEVVKPWLKAFDIMIAMTETFPMQHVYDDYMLNIDRALDDVCRLKAMREKYLGEV